MFGVFLLFGTRKNGNGRLRGKWRLLPLGVNGDCCPTRNNNRNNRNNNNNNNNNNRNNNRNTNRNTGMTSRSRSEKLEKPRAPKQPEPRSKNQIQTPKNQKTKKPQIWVLHTNTCTRGQLDRERGSPPQQQKKQTPKNQQNKKLRGFQPQRSKPPKYKNRAEAPS